MSISDTLSDAVITMDEYLTDNDELSWYQDDLIEEIIRVRAEMAALRWKLDKASVDALYKELTHNEKQV